MHIKAEKNYFSLKNVFQPFEVSSLIHFKVLWETQMKLILEQGMKSELKW